MTQTGQGNVPGILDPVDLDTWNGTQAQLLTLQGASTLPNSNFPIVSILSTLTGKGYYQIAADGGVFTFGDAVFYGSEGGKTLAKPIVAAALTPTAKGYYLVGADGGVFTFGDAVFYGSMAGKPLAQPVDGITLTPSGLGYWLTAQDGGVFTFGDAAYLGRAVYTSKA